MKRIVETLLEEGIDESMIHRILDLIEEEYTILENSKNKFNDEFAEKSGYKVDYYRFGGKKPYKVVPKESSYFQAGYDAPSFRSLKQAQKHIKDSYLKSEK